MSNINSMDQTGSPLKQAVREPASGGADINTDEPGRIDREVIQCRLKLESPAAYVLFPCGETNIRIGGNRGSRLGNRLSSDKNLPGHDCSGGLVGVWEKTTLNE